MFLHILRRQDDKLHFIVNNHSKAQQKMENIINLRNTTYIYIYIYIYVHSVPHRWYNG
jgi:hypothetical protein